MNIIDAHSHLWLRQDTTWDGKAIRTLTNGRSIFLGEEVQMIPPFIIDGRNTAEVFYQRFFVFGMADYLHDGFLEQARQLLLTRGFRGLAIPAHRLLGQSLNSDEMMEMFRMMEANDKRLSITLADGDRQVAELSDVIAECPRLKIAIGHLCMASPPVTPPWENPMWKAQVMLARHENVMIESGGLTWLYNSEFYPFASGIRAIREAADLVGFEKLMWGSDYPRTITAITYRMSYDFITKSQELTEEQKCLFLGDNARRFYQFENLVDLPYIKNMSE